MKFPLTASKGFALIKFIRFIFIALAIGSIIFGAVNIWQETHQIEPLVEKVGGKLLNPLYNLAEHLKSVSINGLFPNGNGFFNDLGQFFRNIYFFLEPILLLYYGLFYLYMFSQNFIIMDSSRKTQSIISMSVLYLLLSFLYLALFTDLPLLTPFTSIGEILGSLSGLF